MRTDPIERDIAILLAGERARVFGAVNAIIEDVRATCHGSEGMITITGADACEIIRERLETIEGELR